MYKEIRSRKSLYHLYKDELINNGDVTEEEVNDMYKKLIDEYEKEEKKAFDNSLIYKKDSEYVNHLWRGYDPTVMSLSRYTGVERDITDKVANILFNIPQDFNPHRLVKNDYEKRLKNISNNVLDWATAEALAYGTLIRDNYRVRLSGQDVKRGTFSHRHACIWDQTSGNELCLYR